MTELLYKKDNFFYFLQLRLTQTLPKSPDCTSTTRFRYVDIKSPSFKTKLSRFKEPSQEDNPKVIVHKDNEENTQQQNLGANFQEGTEHLIEIVIPESNKPVPKERLKPSGETLQTSRSLTGLSVLEQISTLAENQTLPPTPKPKIVSYLPKKHRKLSSEAGHRRVNGKYYKIAPFSLNQIAQVDLVLYVI